MSDPRIRYLVPLGVWLAGVVLITILEGTPNRLPAVALGSNVLFHALRAGALFAIGFALATVLDRAGAGRLPTQLSTSGVGYDPREAAATETSTATADLQGQIDDLEQTVAELAARLDAYDSTP